MSEFRPGFRSASKYAWMAPAIVLLALLLIYLFGNSDADRAKPVQTLEMAESHQRVRIGQPDQQGGLQASAPLSTEIRERVLQNLSEFRAEHQMVGPTVTVTATETAAGSVVLAETLGELLARHNLGKQVAEPRFATNGAAAIGAGNTADSMHLHVASRDVTFAHNLLTALSPMLAGTVLIRFDESLGTGQLQLLITATPQFTAEGVAVFPAGS